MKWTGDWFSKAEYDSLVYSRFIFGEGTLWPSAADPIFYLISRRDQRYRLSSFETDIHQLVRAPAQYAGVLHCLLGDIACSLAALEYLCKKTVGTWDYRHAAIGAWLKYNDLCRDKIFDEARESLKNVDHRHPQERMLHVRLPTLDEWALKRKLGLHCREDPSLTIEQIEQLERSKQFGGGMVTDCGPALVSESELQLLYEGDPINEGSRIQAVVEVMLAEPWVEAFRERDPGFTEVDERGLVEGLGLSFWKKESIGSHRALQDECQKSLLHSLDLI